MDIEEQSYGESLGCFASNLGIANALFAEFMGIILAVECAFQKNWLNLWIESDSKLVTLAIKSPQIVPWQIKNRWLNCLTLLQSMNFLLTHIYREGNHCADKLANLSLSISDYMWWSSTPVNIREDLVKNRLGLPYYRFS